MARVPVLRLWETHCSRSAKGIVRRLPLIVTQRHPSGDASICAPTGSDTEALEKPITYFKHGTYSSVREV